MNVADILAAFPPESARFLPSYTGKRAATAAIGFSRRKTQFTFEEAPGIAARFAGTLAAAGIRPGRSRCADVLQPRRVH